MELIEDGVISSKIAKEVFERMWAGEGAPRRSSRRTASSRSATPARSRRRSTPIIAANPDQAAAVKAKPQAIGWFVGQVMRDTGGKANPAAVNEILKAKLGV